jgi:hypothetical protein
MSTCSVFKNQILLGSGSVTNGATSITGYSGIAPGTGRNVQVMITSSTDVGRVMPNRITVDGGATLTLSQPNPYIT